MYTPAITQVVYRFTILISFDISTVTEFVYDKAFNNCIKLINHFNLNNTQ